MRQMKIENPAGARGRGCRLIGLNSLGTFEYNSDLRNPAPWRFVGTVYLPMVLTIKTATARPS